MTSTTNSLNKNADLIDAEPTKVGLGIQKTNYASYDYAKKKQDKLILGFLSKTIYIGFEHDQNPLIFAFREEPAYQTVLGVNLNYLPLDARKNISRYIVDSNSARLKNNNAPIIKYEDLIRVDKRAKGAIRRYKLMGLRVLDTIPLSEWENAIAVRSGYENHYKQNL